MLVDVNAVSEHSKFIEALDGYSKNSVSLKIEKEDKMKIIIDVQGLDGQDAITFVKSYLKSLKWTTAIYFTVIKHI